MKFFGRLFETFRLDMHYSIMEKKQLSTGSDAPETQDQKAPGPEIESGKARGGDIILKKPWMRIIFMGGLVAWALFMIFAAFIGQG